MAINATDKKILTEANARLKKNYKTITEYLTDNGRLKTTSTSYKSRLTLVENERGKGKREKYVAGSDWQQFIKDKYGWIVNIYAYGNLSLNSLRIFAAFATMEYLMEVMSSAQITILSSMLTMRPQ